MILPMAVLLCSTVATTAAQITAASPLISQQERIDQSLQELDVALDKLDGIVAGLREPPPVPQAVPIPKGQGDPALESIQPIGMGSGELPLFVVPEHVRPIWFNPTVNQARNSLFSAAQRQLRDKPREWNGRIDGFGQRFASSLGRGAISLGIETTVAEFTGERPQPPLPRCLVPGELRGLGLGRAVVRGATSTTFDLRHSVPWARIAGAFGAAALAGFWLPPSEHSVGSVLIAGSVALGVKTALSIGREVYRDHSQRTSRAQLPQCDSNSPSRFSMPKPKWKVD